MPGRRPTSRGLRRAARALALLLALFALPRGLAGQTAHLVRDLETGGSRSDSPSQPASLLAAAGKLFFVATAGTSPPELWTSDGTPLGTEQVSDGCPNNCQVHPLAALGGVALFQVSAYPEPFDQIWRSDGTRKGTYPLTGEALTPAGVPLSAAAGHFVYFAACQHGGPCGLARTDGTPGGTVFLHAFNDPLGGIAERAGKAYVATFDALWTSDGTPDGTRKVADLPGSPALLTATAHRLVFTVTSLSQSQLWTSDGTAAGTRQIVSFSSPAAFQQTAGFKVDGDRVYFVADDVAHGAEIWVSDSTAAGTHAVTDFGFFNPFQGRLAVSQMEVLGNRLLFLATDGLSPVKLWKSDGAPATTALVADLEISLDAPLLRVGNRVVFRGGDGVWATDGTAAGTVEIRAAISDGPFPIPGGAVFDVAAGPPGGQPIGPAITLWSTDGTPAGTRRLNDAPLALPFTQPNLDLAGIAAAGGKIFFVLADGNSFDGIPQTALWATDGRPGGGRFVASSEAENAGSDPYGLVALGGQVFFRATAGGVSAIWQSAGDEASTVPVTAPIAPSSFFDGPTAVGDRILFWQPGDDLSPQLWSADAAAHAADTAVELTHFASGRFFDLPPRLTAFGGRAFFALQPTGGDVEMWASDGTAAGTGRVLALPGIRSVHGLTAAGSALYFLAGDAAGEAQLWTSDGTAAGTRRISADPALDLSDAPGFTAVGPLVFFSLRYALWRTDGSAAGTVRLYTFDSSSSSDEMLGLAPLGGAVYFLTEQSLFDEHLWRSDGTPAGTVEIAHFPGNSAAPFTSLVASGNRLFLAVDDGVHGRELWASDGTAGGTVLLRDIAPGPRSSEVDSLVAAGGRVFFTADDGVHGIELWQSDGTADGTRLAADVAPEALSSNPRELTVVAGGLYFTADDALHGRELWVLPLAGPAGCQPSAAHLCLAGGRFQVEAEWRDFQGNSGHGTAVALTSDTGYFWFFNPANVEVVTKVLDGRGVNQAFWVFYGALSSVEYTLTVTDTETGLTRRYFNPAGELASVGDTHGFGPLGAFDTERNMEPPRAARSLTLVDARTDPRAATGSCAAGPGRLCLNDGRFAVTASWKDFQGHTGQGTAVALTGDTGYFWFFNPTNVEVVAKVLDGRPVNDKFWLFYGALSSVEYTLTVTDTQTGAVRMYKNASGNLASAADTGAF